MNTPDLDAMLTREQAAQWLQVTPRWLAEDAMKRRPSIPVFKPGHATARYHPRTIIATLAKRAGVQEDLITVSFGTTIFKFTVKTGIY